MSHCTQTPTTQCIHHQLLQEIKQEQQQQQKAVSSVLLLCWSSNTWNIYTETSLHLIKSLSYRRLKKTLKYLRHSPSLHGIVIKSGPSSLQFFPPQDGEGLVQVLVSIFVPSPHVTLHSDSDHSVYPPSIATQQQQKKHLLCLFLQVITCKVQARTIYLYFSKVILTLGKIRLHLRKRKPEWKTLHSD